MNNAKNILIQYNSDNNYGTTDSDLIETLLEENIVYKENLGSSRWWENWFQVIKIHDDYLGYHWATANRDESIFDLGWEFDWNTLQEYEPKEITTITYVLKE